MSISISEPSSQRRASKKPPELILNSHSTISEKSSEENDFQLRSFTHILNDFNENDDECLQNFISTTENGVLGEIDLEFAFLESKSTPLFCDSHVLRKTSFFYLKNRESVSEKTRKNSIFDSNVVKHFGSRRGTLQSRRGSVMPVSSKGSAKNDRMESLAKIQSDIINKIYKQNEKSYNFIVNGRKFQFAEKSWFLYDERNAFRLKVIILFKSRRYKRFILVVCLINLLAFVLYDYSNRIGHNNASIVNKASWALDLICNIIFTGDFLLRSIGMGFFLGKGTLMKSSFGAYYFFILIASWMIYLPENEITPVCMCIRLIKNNRLIVFIQPLKKNMDSFLLSLPNFMKTYMSLISLMIFYSIMGLHMLKGFDENRCRMSPVPVDNTWFADENITNLCGEWQCPSERFCINPSDYGFHRIPNENEIPELNYGLTNFNTIFNSFFTVLHFIDTIGWTSITYNYWKSMNKLASALFFTTLVIFGALIFMNILLATLYESFVSKESIKHSIEKKLKKKGKTHTKDQVNLADLTFAKTLRSSPTVKQTKNIRHYSFDAEAYHEKVANKLSAQKEKVNRFRVFLIETIESRYFRDVIMFFLLLDFIFLCQDRYPIPLAQSQMIYLIDFAIFWVFFVEIILRLVVYGPRLFFISWFNIYDALIIFLNLNQYIYEFIVAPEAKIYIVQTQTGPILRSLKLLRVYFFLYYSTSFPKISLLTKGLFQTLNKIKYFMLFVTLLTITAALIGRELFAYRVHVLEDGKMETPRINFDNFYHSIISIVLAFFNEEWNVVMYENYMSFGSAAIIFYMFLIIIGQMTFIILLRALILNYFIKSTSKEFFTPTKKRFGMKALTFLKSKIQTLKNNLNSKQASPLLKNTMKNNSLPRKSEVIKPFKRTSWKESINLFNRSKTSVAHANKKARKSFEPSTFKFPKNSINNPEFSSKNLSSFNMASSVFRQYKPRVENDNENNMANGNGMEGNPNSPSSPNPKKTTIKTIVEDLNRYQVFFYNVLISKTYQYFMFLVTLTSMVLQILDSTFDAPDSALQQTIKVIDLVLFAIYLLEFMMNVATYGFLFKKNSYLRQSFYNKLDFCNIIISICDLFIDKYQNRTCQTLKIVRTFRILKLATTTTQEIQIISKAFLETFPNLLVSIVFFSIFLGISSLIATNYMKGSLFYCENQGYEGQIIDKWDCFDSGGDWIDEDIAYNNVLTSLMSLFEISSCQGWSSLMEKSIDGRGVDLEPVEDYNTAKALFFLVFFFISSFIMLNMFVGIIIENIIVNKNKERGIDKLTEEQKEWAIIKANILKLKPKPLKIVPENHFKRILFYLLNNKYVNIIFDACIVWNLLILMSYHHRESRSTTTLLNSLNYLMIAIFTLENTMRLLLSPKHYFHSKKCLYEALILLLIWIDIIIQASISIPQTHIENPYLIFVGIVKGLQATRIYRIFKRIQSVKQIYDTLFHVMPTLLNMLLLIILILYMYAIIGIALFSYLKPQSTINGDDIHFRTFPIAFFTLVRVASSETWFLVFSDAVRSQQPNFVCHSVTNYYDFEEWGFLGCGSSWAYPFFLSFHILFSLIILNLFVAIVLTQYDDEFKAHQSAINKYQLNGIKKEWRESDPKGDGYINYKDFWRFASKISGFLNIQQTVESKKKFLKLLRIPVYENAKTKIFSYKFHDVIVELSKMSVLVNYGVMNLDVEDDGSSDVLDSGEDKSESSKKDRLFNKTQFFCGDMSSIILISKLIRKWVKKGKKEYDANNAFTDILDITKIAMKRRKTEKLELLAKMKEQDSLKEEEEEEDKAKENENRTINDSGVSPNRVSFDNGGKIQPAPIIRYNIMNDVTVDEGLSGNRSIEGGLISNRPLIEEGNKGRRASILKSNQYGFGEGSGERGRTDSEVGGHKKKNPGKKIQFAVD